MRLSLFNFKMFVYCPLESGIHFRSTLELWGGLDVLQVEAEPDAGMTVVHL
jgi:hypothetical protein